MGISRLKRFFPGEVIPLLPEIEINFLIRNLKKNNPEIIDKRALEQKKAAILKQMILTRLNLCNSCGLATAEYHTKKVPGEGNLLSPLMLVGEGPGFEEDRLGRPFVGKAGKLLDRILTKAAIRREKIYITNIIKCRPPYNRTPLENEIKACNNIILFEIAAVNPAVIITLGSVAFRFFGGEGSILRTRGNWMLYKNKILVMPTYHPAYLLRQNGRNMINSSWLVWDDFQNAIKKVKELRPDYDFS